MNRVINCHSMHTILKYSLASMHTNSNMIQVHCAISTITVSSIIRRQMYKLISP